MSNDVYPSNLPGLSIDVEKEPEFNTLIQRAVGGRELRMGQQVYPLWNFRLAYNFLRDTSVFAELKTLAGFFLKRQGMADSFLFTDPDDNAVVLQPTGLSTGSNLTFQLLRTYGGHTEPVYNLNATGPVNFYALTVQGLSRVNYLRHSQQFANGVWAKFNCTATDNAATAPDGTTTAASIVKTAVGNHYLTQSVAYTAHANTTFTLSFWIRAVFGSGVMVLRIRDGAAVEIGNATVTAGSSWSRFSVTATFGPSPASGIGVFLDPADDSGAPGDTFEVWGAVLEDETSMQPGYIPTTTSGFLYAVAPLTGVVTVSFALPAGWSVYWTGSFYYRCRFLSDKLGLTKFLHQIWKTGKVSFVGSLQDKI